MSTKKRSTRAFGFSRRFLIHLGVFFVLNLALAIWVRATDENPNWYLITYIWFTAIIAHGVGDFVFSRRGEWADESSGHQGWWI